jgi:hypothetical protein
VPEEITVLIEVKVKVFLGFFFTEHYAMKAYWGSRGGQLHAPAALPPGKEPLVPIR